jgi:hypothetical protein
MVARLPSRLRIVAMKQQQFVIIFGGGYNLAGLTRLENSL